MNPSSNNYFDGIMAGEPMAIAKLVLAALIILAAVYILRQLLKNPFFKVAVLIGVVTIAYLFFTSPDILADSLSRVAFWTVKKWHKLSN